MSGETERAATPARGVAQRSKYLREHTGSRREEGVAFKVVQGVHASACVRLQDQFASGCAAREREGESCHATHVHPICICTCAVRVHLCATTVTGTSILTATRNTFHERLSPNKRFKL